MAVFTLKVYVGRFVPQYDSRLFQLQYFSYCLGNKNEHSLPINVYVFTIKITSIAFENISLDNIFNCIDCHLISFEEKVSSSEHSLKRGK